MTEKELELERKMDRKGQNRGRFQNSLRNFGFRLFNNKKLEWLVYFDIKRIRRDNEKREKRARLVEKERRKYGSAKLRWFGWFNSEPARQNYTAFYVT